MARTYYQHISKNKNVKDGFVRLVLGPKFSSSSQMPPNVLQENMIVWSVELVWSA